MKSLSVDEYNLTSHPKFMESAYLINYLGIMTWTMHYYNIISIFRVKTKPLFHEHQNSTLILMIGGTKMFWELSKIKDNAEVAGPLEP